MFEILPRDWNLKPIFTQKWASVDMNWGLNPQPTAIPTLASRKRYIFFEILVQRYAYWRNRDFLADRTNGRAYAAVLRPSVVCLSVPVHDRAPQYLADHLITASDAAPRRLRLRSANLNRLTVLRCRLSTYGCRAFYHALARQSGTRCQINLEKFSQFCWLWTILEINNFHAADTSVTSALDVL